MYLSASNNRSGNKIDNTNVESSNLELHVLSLDLSFRNTEYETLSFLALSTFYICVIFRTWKK